jgi:chemotaxis protein MotB
VNVQDEILFASGSASIGREGTAVLKKVAAQLRKLPHTVEVQGHTDDVPVRQGARFPSNWELGAARAAAVVRLFEDEKIGKPRLRAVSFADTRPVDSNKTPEGRARNRRIEIRLAPVGAEPAAGAPAD